MKTLEVRMCHVLSSRNFHVCSAKTKSFLRTYSNSDNARELLFSKTTLIQKYLEAYLDY